LCQTPTPGVQINRLQKLFTIADRNPVDQHLLMKCFPFVSAYLLVPVLALPAFAADRTEEVRATEVAFAKAFAERDAKKFFSYLTDDAQFLGRLKTMHGKQEVIAGWSEFFKAAVAPFRWQPERVVTNAAGDLGFSSGPVFDEAVVQTGTFTSTWVRQPDGSWKILFDGGSACPTTKQSAQ
jgi:ketosteroid isomerase-like protein